MCISSLFPRGNCVDSERAIVTSTRLGRARALIQPAEYYLSRFVQNLENCPANWSSFNPGCHWQGVHCDSAERVTKIMCIKFNLEGNVSWGDTPPTMERMDMTENRIEGSFETSLLPDRLRLVWLRGNRLTGRLDLTTLPQSLISLNLSENKLNGPIDLLHLPSALEKLYLNRNELTGRIHLGQLPASLQYLYLEDNQFTGQVTGLHLLSNAMIMCRLMRNQLDGWEYHPVIKW